MEMLRKNCWLSIGLALFGVGLFALAVVLAAGFFLSAVRDADPKLVPLVGSFITAIVSIPTLIIAGWALWVAYANMATPSRVEMEKERLKLILDSLMISQEAAVALYDWYETTDADKYKPIYMDCYYALGKKLMIGEVLLPRDVQQAFFNFRMECNTCANCIGPGRDNVEIMRKMIDDLFVSSLDIVVRVCRNSIGSDASHQMTKQLMGISDIRDVQRSQNR